MLSVVFQPIPSTSKDEVPTKCGKKKKVGKSGIAGGQLIQDQDYKMNINNQKDKHNSEKTENEGKVYL